MASVISARPSMLVRRAESFSSNPDQDVDEEEEHNIGYDYTQGGGNGGNVNGLRPSSPQPGIYPRPMHQSFTHNSLTVPVPHMPRESYVPYSEYPNPRPPQQMPLPHGPSYVDHDYDVDENMEIGTTTNFTIRPNDELEEFALREPPAPRPSRLRRFARALFKPFRAIKSVMRLPRFLGGKRSKEKRPITQSSSWDFRDPTPAPPSIRNARSPDGSHRTAEQVTTVLFPQPMTAPVTMIEPHDSGIAPEMRDGRNESVDSSDSESDDSHSTHQRSHISGHSLSHRSMKAHEETNKVDLDAVRASATTRTSAAPFSPSAAAPSTSKGSSRGRSSRTYSTISYGSSLVHHIIRFYRGLVALYHLPWCAVPPKRVAADFVPALGSRSKYRVHRGPLQVPVPPSVLNAAAAAERMEPAEGKSWYQPSPQQIQQRLAKGKSASRHAHRSHPQSYLPQHMYNFYGQQRPNTTNMEGHPMYMCGPPVPPYPPSGSPYGAQQFYMIPGPPPPPPPAPGTNSASGPRAPPPARRSSTISRRSARRSLRPGPRPMQNSLGQVQNGATPDNSPGSPGRGDIQRPVPPTQPMYMLVQAPSGPPFPPSYGNIYPSYPYSPPWMSPQRI